MQNKIQKIKISYPHVIGNNAIYCQRINGLIRKNIELFNDAIRAEIAMEYPRRAEYSDTNGYAEAFLTPMRYDRVDKNRVYINHTQRRFINLFLKLNLKDRNTFLTVIN